MRILAHITWFLFGTEWVLNKQFSHVRRVRWTAIKTWPHVKHLSVIDALPHPGWEPYIGKFDWMKPKEVKKAVGY